MDPLIGQSLGPYELVGRLGAGGMGTVYRAVHRLLDQPRALKVLPAHLAADETFVERFQREARTAARLRHPNIVLIHDVGEHDGAYYIAMELVAGQSLRQLLRTHERMGLVRATRLLGQLAEALDFAHADGVAHRDVKPANVLVRGDDHVVLADFGIARAGEAVHLTRTGMMVGTPDYLAPEAVSEAGGGPSADLYALGVVAYEMLCGRAPFAGLDTPAMLYAQLHTAPPPPRSLRADLPAAAEAVLLRQLAKDPAERYATGAAFVHALASAERPTPAPVELLETPTPPRGVPILAERGLRPEQPRALAPRPPSTVAPPVMAAGPAAATPPARRGAAPSGADGLLRGLAALLAGGTLAGTLLAMGLLWWSGWLPRIGSESTSTPTASLAIAARPTPEAAQATLDPAAAAPAPEQEEMKIAREAAPPSVAPSPEARPAAPSPSSPLPVPSPVPVAAPATRIAIRAPADGALVPEHLTLEGRLPGPLPPGSHLWLVVRPLVEGGRWYPAHGEIRPAPDDTWTTGIYLGGPPGIRHEIRIGVVDAATHAQLLRHLAEQRDEPLSAWTPPENWGEARVTVIKQ